MEITEGTRVRFIVEPGTLQGIVARAWGRNADNLTIISDDGRTFVRLASRVTPVDGDEPEAEVTRASYVPGTTADPAARAASLVRLMNAWLRPAFGTTPADKAPPELVEWCRSARDLLADFGDWTAAR